MGLLAGVKRKFCLLWVYCTTLLPLLSCVQVGGALVRGAHQGADTPGTPVFPYHQAYQLPHQLTASGGQQLSAGLLHGAGCCYPPWGEGEAHVGAL